jgi:hypothetical protein
MIRRLLNRLRRPLLLTRVVPPYEGLCRCSAAWPHVHYHLRDARGTDIAIVEDLGDEPVYTTRKPLINDENWKHMSHEEKRRWMMRRLFHK